MLGHDIIVVGASAGGVEALTQLVQNLPPDLPAAVFVVLHLPAHGISVLPNILNRNGRLKASHPRDGEAIEYGQIYAAPPDHHLLVKRGHVHLSRGPKENGHRPAVDTLFRTAARAYGRRVVAVILSGSLDDGTAGIIAVKNRGGVAVVQSPQTAMFPSMPKSAIDNATIDYILPVSEIAVVLGDLARQPVAEEETDAISEEMEMEADMAELDLDALQNEKRPGIPSGFACPECGGALWELNDGDLIRFRCRVGHAYSADTLLAEQSDALEEALWVALRALEESAALALRMAKRASDRNNSRSAEQFAQQAEETKQRAALIRNVLLKEQGNGQS